MSGLPFCYKNFNLSLFNLDWCALRKCWSKPSYKLDKWKREYRWLKEKPFCRDDIGMWNVNRFKHLILIRQGLQYLLFVIRSNYVGPFFDETKKGLLWQQAWQNKDSSLSKVPSTGLDFATVTSPYERYEPPSSIFLFIAWHFTNADVGCSEQTIISIECSVSLNKNIEHARYFLSMKKVFQLHFWFKRN